MSFSVRPWSRQWHDFWLCKPFGLDIADLARCETQVLYNTDTPDMNGSQSWSWPSLNFLTADLTWLDMYIWLSLLNPCLHSDETRYNLNNWSLWLLNILNLLNKSKLKIANVLNVNRIRSMNFQKNVSKQQLACRWTWSMNLKPDATEISLASCNKVIAATWLR